MPDGGVPTASEKGALKTPKIVVSFRADAADVHEQVERLLREVHPFHQDLACLCGDYYTELACIFYLAGDERPAIHFTPQQLKKLADLNAHIDVDLYLLE